MSVFISGGAGFVGSSLARCYRDKYPTRRIVAFDNLRRRGSELNLRAFKDLDIEFVHGDIRAANDFGEVQGEFDLFIDAAAEPSAHAGADSSPHYVPDTNLVGTLNSLEFARKRCGNMIFLSTSRVYSVTAQRAIPYAKNQRVCPLIQLQRSLKDYLKTVYLKRLTRRNSAPYTVRQSWHLSSLCKILRDV